MTAPHELQPSAAIPAVNETAAVAADEIPPTKKPPRGRLPEEHSAVKKMMWRLVPLFGLMFFINYLDRTNISVAALQMNDDIGLTTTAYGLAAGIFSITYAIVEIPSNIIMDRVGARKWLARIMVSWGIVGMLTAFVVGPYSFMAARLLMGVAEAGFFPGIVLYLTMWFPAKYRATAMSVFYLGNPLSVILGGPLSALILMLPSIGWWSSWRWVYLLEAIPAVIIGIVLFKILDNRPEDAKWLTRKEKDWINNSIAAENLAKGPNAHSSIAGAFKSVPTLWLSAGKFLMLTAQLGIALWLPLMIKSLGVDNNLTVTLINGVPYIFAGIMAVVIGRRSDRKGERTYHIAIPGILGAVGFFAAAASNNLVVGGIGIIFATVGIWVANTLAWSLPPKYLTGVALATGIALVNAVGNLGGFFGPFIVGCLKTETGGYQIPLAVLGGALLANALIIIGLGYWDKRVQRKASAGRAGQRRFAP